VVYDVVYDEQRVRPMPTLETDLPVRVSSRLLAAPVRDATPRAASSSRRRR